MRRSLGSLGSERLVGGVIVIPRIKTGHAQIRGQTAQVGIKKEPRDAQRLGPHLKKRLYVYGLKDRDRR